MRKVSLNLLLVAFSLFFLYAGFAKLIDPVEFGRSIERYRLLNPPWTQVAGLYVPWIECISAVALLLRGWRKAGLIVLFSLLVFFEIILTITWLRGINIDCGCLGNGLESSVGFAILRNIGLIAAAIVLYATCRRDDENAR